MFLIDQVLLLAAVLLLLGIVSSKVSARLGLPVLVLFVIVGMLAGERGIGGIPFDDPGVAHALGTLALAVILFDGGLQTPRSSIRAVWKPTAALATLGVLVTATVTGSFAAWLLDLPLLEGLLIGAIVGSTDAAAVFSLLRSSGIHIKKRIKSTLEVESASNDPMAIFLTVGLLEILVNDVPFGLGLLQLFIFQIGIGAAVGLGVGWVAVRLINRIGLEVAGLYPVLVAGCGLLAFGLAANMGGSGFLAIFVAGVIVGNSRIVFQRDTFLFHDGLAWLSQITMFVVLGLLIDPKELLDVWVEGLAISAVLIFLARPLAVAPLLKIFGFDSREIALISWVGLRGSVPIILAIFPLLFGLPGAALIFNVVFFVVLISATLQGSTLPLFARRLGLTEPPPPARAATLQITSIRDINADIVEYSIRGDSRAVGRRLSQLALPEGTVVAMITRHNTVIPPRGSTIVQAHDHLYVVLRPDTRPFVDRVFSQAMEPLGHDLPDTELRLKGSTTVEDLRNSYGIHLHAPDSDNLHEILREQLHGEPKLDASVILEGTSLWVRELVDQRISTVGLLRAEKVGAGDD